MLLFLDYILVFCGRVRIRAVSLCLYLLTFVAFSLQACKLLRMGGRAYWALELNICGRVTILLVYVMRC